MKEVTDNRFTEHMIDVLIQCAQLSNKTDELLNYVYLREDEKGRYIEYAFVDGSPDENRCLSWYVLGRKANGMDNPINKDLTKDIPSHKEIDKIYKLSIFNCGGKKCKPGYPNSECIKNGIIGKSWCKEYPNKCACYDLMHITDIDEEFRIFMDLTTIINLL